MTFPGPDVLGRGLVILPGRAVPAPFDAARHVTIDDAALADPGEVVDRLHEAWLRRQRVVVVLAVDADRFRHAEPELRDPWRLGPAFDLPLERLHHLVWANNYDGRAEGEPRWWWSVKAERAAERAAGRGRGQGQGQGRGRGRGRGRVSATPDGPADITIDGAPAWCDGGPRQPIDPVLLGPGAVGLVHRDSIDIGGDAVRVAPPPGPPTASDPPLAPDQMAAVTHDVGPARVIAPAGSGKTRVLTARLRHLLADRGWERDAVAAVAYNKAAADEMAERTVDLGADIRTLNSLALSILNGTGGFLSTGRSRRTVSDERDVRELLTRAANAVGVEPTRAVGTDPWVSYVEGMRAVRLALRDPAEVERAADAPGLPDVLASFRRVMADTGVVDFDGQVDEAVRILLSNPAARARAQHRCRHLLVDEFQDLTPAHVLLLRLCAGPTFDVFAVGDDDQTIYGFGGASPAFLVDVGDYLPGASSHALEVNYRCRPAVVSAATSLLSYNHDRVDKVIRPADGATGGPGDLDIRRLPATGSAAEAKGVLDKWVGDGRVLGETAVLARVNSALLPVQVLLTEAGVPCRAAVGPQILERTGVRTALAYLRIALDPRRIDGRDVMETVRRPSRKLSPKVVEWMVGRRGTTSIDEIRRLAGRLQQDRDVVRVQGYAADLATAAEQVRSGDAAAFFTWVRTGLGLGDVLDELDAGRRELDRSTHTDDLVALEQVAALHPDPVTFEDWLRGALRRGVEAGRQEVGAEGRVEVSTVHRVKGLQWPLVVVVGVDAGTIPHRRAEDEEEERRILHVAITRAAEQCVVLADEDAPSPFLAELDGSAPHVAARARRAPHAEARPSAAGTTAASGRGGGARAAGSPAPPPSLIEATPGLTVTRSGHEGEVIEARRDGAVLAIGGAKEVVRWGTRVEAGGVNGLLVAPGVESALRTWRTELARVGGAPAYTVLSDADLQGVVAALPATLPELAACRGIGPSKLERFGDELLAVIDEALGSS